MARKLGENINPALRGLCVNIEKLRPDPDNVRRHGARSIDAISRSLVEFGQQKPVIALSDGTVIAGNGTLAAAERLGWKRLACVTFADAAKARAFAISDNRAAELSTWDVDDLVAQLAALPEVDLVGFSLDEVKDLRDPKRQPFAAELVAVSDLKPHPRNYRKHPADQLAHIARSIEAHGFYRNVVVARDNTILAGHGVVEAVRMLGKPRVPVIRLDLDPGEPRALKVLTSDNEISNLAETDDRALTEILRGILQDDPSGLPGTGFDEQQLAALAFVTRPASELADSNAARQWVGLPAYEEGADPIKLVVTFKDEADRQRFLEEAKLRVDTTKGRTWSTRWPWTEWEDRSAVRFEAAEEKK